MKWILFLAIAMSVPSHAAELRDLVRAKTALQLELAVVRDQRLEEFRSSCRRELDGTDLPRSCFRVLAQEKADGLRTTEDLERENEWLTRVCMKKARVASRFSSLKETRDLPDDCQRVAADRLADLRYRVEEESPAKLLEDDVNVR